MAGFESVKNDLRSEFATEFGSAEPGVAIAYANGPPLAAQNPKADFWCRFEVIDGPARLPEINSDTSEARGEVVVQLFGPLQLGTGRLNELADVVRNIFQGQNIGAARCQASEVISLGHLGSEGPWWQINVSTRFTFDSTPV